jgi:hypothetical protein
MRYSTRLGTAFDVKASTSSPVFKCVLVLIAALTIQLIVVGGRRCR